MGSLQLIQLLQQRMVGTNGHIDPFQFGKGDQFPDQFQHLAFVIIAECNQDTERSERFLGANLPLPPNFGPNDRLAPAKK